MKSDIEIAQEAKTAMLLLGGDARISHHIFMKERPYLLVVEVAFHGEGGRKPSGKLNQHLKLTIYIEPGVPSPGVAIDHIGD